MRLDPLHMKRSMIHTDKTRNFFSNFSSSSFVCFFLRFCLGSIHWKSKLALKLRSEVPHYLLTSIFLLRRGLLCLCMVTIRWGFFFYSTGGPLASFLCDKFGSRTVALLGAVMACTGCLLSLVSSAVWQLALTYGALTGGVRGLIVFLSSLSWDGCFLTSVPCFLLL